MRLDHESSDQMVQKSALSKVVCLLFYSPDALLIWTLESQRLINITLKVAEVVELDVGENKA